jgi:hypothetical protein
MEQDMPKSGPADDAAIREQAYYFWEQAGRPAGRETEYWQRAMVKLSEKSQMDTLTEPAPKPKAAPRLTAAASKAKSAPAKAESANKPKKK